MDFVNLTQPIGIILTRGTQTVTGDIVATLFIVIIFLWAICAMMNIPFEISIIFILPLIISIAAFYSSFLLLMILIFIYAAMLIANHFVIR